MLATMRQPVINAFALKLCCLAAAFALLAFAPASKAQDAPRSAAKSRSIFERGWQADQGPFQRQAPVVKRSRRSEAPAQNDAVEEEPAEKLDDARVVLVIGDFMASGLARALDDDYAQSPDVRIVDETNGSSGLVRTDFYDWPKEIGGIVDEVRPAVVVMMIGANDRQTMNVDASKEAPRSDVWTAEYVKRVEAVTKAVGERKVPLVWVGQPAFKYASMSSDMLALDDIYQRVVEAAKGDYVDIWDGFVDENGAFRFTGADVNGQPVRLRSDDGITLSKAGKRKVAFYVEKPLNRILGRAATPEGAPEADIAPGPDNASSPDRTAPISLSAPPLGVNTDLLGSKTDAKPRAARTAAERLTIEGIAPSSPPGRADDFGGAGGARPAVGQPALLGAAAAPAGDRSAAGKAPPPPVR
jgi:hypothetical protein